MKKAILYIFPLLFTLLSSQQAQAQITGTLTVCVGGTTPLADAMPGGVWTSSTPSVAVVGLTTGFVYGMSAGTATISYTAGATVHTAVVTVNPLASAGSISGPSSVCAGTTITLTASVPGGTWSASNANATVSGGVVSGVSPGTCTITYTVTTSCGTATATKLITINALPSVSAISGSSTVCVSSAISLFSATPGGAWSATNPAATVTGGGIVTGVSAGIDTIIYTVTNMCGPTSVSKIVTVNPLPLAGSLSGPAVVCIASSITLSSTVSGGVWTASNANATVSGGVVTGGAAGIDTISYTVTNGCGSATVTATVSISPAPFAGTISGVADVCESASITLTSSVSGGVWGVSTGMASVTGGVTTGIAAGVDTIKYTISTGCGIDVAAHVITVNPMPDAGVIGGPAGVCNGSSVTLSASGPGGAWSSDDVTIADVDGSGNVDGLMPGSAMISYVVTNGCGGDTAFHAISVDVPAGPVIAPELICSGSVNTITNSTPGGTWSSSNPVTAFVFGGSLIGGFPGIVTITYTVTNGCGTTTADKVIDVILCLPLNEPVAGTTTDELSIFPNPSDGTFTLNIASAKNEAITVLVTNVLGGKVIEFKANTNEQTDVKLDAVPGIYFLTAANNTITFTQRILITE